MSVTLTGALASPVVHAMRFVAGMFGVVEDAAGVLSPEFGWAVTHDLQASRR